MKTLLINLALLSWLCCPTVNASDWGIDKLMQAMAEQQTQQARFTETREMALLQQDMTSQGALTFERPDRLTKQFDQPHGLRYEIVAKRLLIQRSDGSEEIIRLENAPQLLAFVSAMRAVLAGDRNSLQEHFELSLTGQRQDWQLHLTPKARQLASQLRGIEITGSSNRITTFLVTEQAGDRLLMRLHHPNAD